MKNMIKSKLIFIEGVSGVGKTTTAALLRDKLEDMGYTVTCHLEGDCENPLDPFKGTYPPTMSLTEFTEIYLQYWRRFAEKGNGNLLILDGTLLHHQINDLIRNYNASKETIVEHLTVLLQVIQQLNPIVFYLLSLDVGQRLAHAQESRRKSVPTKEQIVFWENRKHVDLYALDRLPVKSHLLNVDDGWNTILETITEHIM
jgi:Cdc6-like AAA superfamily ATPase